MLGLVLYRKTNIGRALFVFIIEDEIHAEPQGEFRTRGQALAELERRAAIPWNEPPNRAPCSNSLNCGRRYELIEYDDSESIWKELTRELILEISAAGVRWHSTEKTAHP